MRLIARLRRETGIEVPLRTLFEGPPHANSIRVNKTNAVPAEGYSSADRACSSGRRWGRAPARSISNGLRRLGKHSADYLPRLATND
jgi:hypothetical protein